MKATVCKSNRLRGPNTVGFIRTEVNNVVTRFVSAALIGANLRCRTARW